MGTEIFINMNWLAVIVASLAYFFVGAIWYSFLFKNAWIKNSGVNVNDPNAKKGMAQIMLTSLILVFICSIGIAIFLSRVGPSSWMSGAKVGLVAGVCFSVTAISNSYLFEKRPLGLHLVNAGYNIVGCVVAGIILAIWP
jgi:hypothetical protein